VDQEPEVKQYQHRPKTRAPHGSRQFPARLGAWVTPRQYQAFRRNGGSEWLRRLLDDALSLGA
jgi:hypothetical protein